MNYSNGSRRRAGIGSVQEPGYFQKNSVATGWPEPTPYKLTSMKSALAFVLLASFAFAAGSAEKEVLAAVDAWKQAVLKGDAAALGRLYHDDLAYTHSNAMTQTKAVAIAAETSPTGVYKGVEMRDIDVHVYGNTAILEYKLDLTHYAGDTAHLHEIMVWLKSPQGWQLLARHATKLT
jgi:ketosteroid isomerase-like protein